MKTFFLRFLGVGVLIGETNGIVDIGSFFPFGVANGDQYLAPGDNTYSSEQNLSIPFNFFSSSHTSLWINVNGAISFLAPITTYTPTCSPVSTNFQMVSPFWADVDTKYETPSPASAVSFRESTNSSDLQKAESVVAYAFNLASVDLNWAYIVTWYNVTFYNDDPSRQIRNSFQAVLTTNGENSFVIFFYNKIQWTTGQASNGNSCGLCGIPAQVGFDSGDGINRYMLDVSCTNSVINVNNLSNIGVPGEFVFQVDASNIATPPPITRPTRSTFSPTSAEMIISSFPTKSFGCIRHKIWLDIVAVMDNSLSMGQFGFAQVQANLASIVGQLTLNSIPGYSSRIALVSFASSATTVADLTAFNDTNSFEEKLSAIPIANDDKVNILSGLQMANTIFVNNDASNRGRVVILYTSAYEDTGSQNPRPLALYMREDNIKIITIAFEQKMGAHEANKVGELAWPGFDYVYEQLNLSDKIFDALCQTNCFCLPEFSPSSTGTVMTETSSAITTAIQDTTPTQLLPNMSSTFTPILLPKASPSFPIWWILGSSVVLIISIISILIFIVLLIRRKKVLEQQLIEFQNDILEKAENKNIEKQILKKDRQWKMFLDAKNLIIQFDNVLGQGSNATVYKAFQKNANRFPFLRQTSKSRNFLNTNIVAAKVPTQFNSNEAEEFIREINSLIFLKTHDHIILFLGWTILGEIPVLITELADTTLLTYVQGISKHENFLKPCLQFLWQISFALEYISEKKLIHRDVACRNILLKNKTTAKLADFGLCCFSDEKTGIFKDTFNKKFPIKWLSLEALNQCIFSEKSDVWAFGILCFEVFSYGSIPYSKMSNSEMIEFLQNGKRLEKPLNAPDYIYELILNCWWENPQNRPNFNEICKGIRKMLENETLKYGYLTLENAFDDF